MNSVFMQTLIERRWFMLGWGVGLAFFAALMVSFYPAMSEQGSLDALVENMPKAFEGLIGDLANLQEFPSYIASQLFDIRLPLIAGIMAIILGQSLSTREEERGELRTLLAQPIGRTRLLLEKWLALVVVTGVGVVALALGTYATMPTVEGAEIGFGVFMKLLGMTWLLMLTYGTIAFGIGAATGNKGIANAVSILLIIGSFIITTFSPAVDWLADYEKISLLHYFPAVDIVESGVALSDVGTLLAVLVAVLAVAVVAFRVRDVR